MLLVVLVNVHLLHKHVYVCIYVFKCVCVCVCVWSYRMLGCFIVVYSYDSLLMQLQKHMTATTCK